jgi:hypothetical protein
MTLTQVVKQLAQTRRDRLKNSELMRNLLQALRSLGDDHKLPSMNCWFLLYTPQEVYICNRGLKVPLELNSSLKMSRCRKMKQGNHLRLT